MRSRHLMWLSIVVLLLATGCPTKQVVRFDTGVDHVRQQQFEEGLAVFEAFARANPDHEDTPLALYSAARIHLLVRDDQPAGEAKLDELIGRYADSEWAFHAAVHLAEVLLAAEDAKGAAERYGQALAIGQEVFPPPTRPADTMFGALQTGSRLYMDVGAFDQAEPLLALLMDAGIDDRRQMPPVYAAYGESLEGVGRNEEAAQVYLDLIATYPASDAAVALVETREKIDDYAEFDWEPFAYFAEGYEVRFTWPGKAREHLSTLAEHGAGPELARTGMALLPWVHLVANDFAPADAALAAYSEKYPDTPHPVLEFYAMYRDSYQQDFEHKQYITRYAVLIRDAVAAGDDLPAEAYETMAQDESWQVVDHTERLGYFNPVLYLDRPTEAGDTAYLRFHIQGGEGASTALEVDTDDPWSVWLDGVAQEEPAEGAKTLDLTLAEGWNEVLIRIVEADSGMMATLRLLTPAGETETGLAIRADVNDEPETGGDDESE